MTLGQRLAFYRKKSCLTQQQLGKMINVSAQAVSKWENDQAEPDVAMICKLSQIYHISIDTLLTGKDHPPVAPESITTQKQSGRTQIPHLRTLVLTFIILLIVAAVACTLINIFINKAATLPLTHALPASFQYNTYKGVLL